MLAPTHDRPNDALEKGSVDGGTEEEVKQDSSQITFPEGGGRAWSVVAGAFCIAFCTFGYLNAYG